MAKAKLKIGDNVFPAYEISSDLNSNIHNKYFEILERLWYGYPNNNEYADYQLMLLNYILGIKNSDVYLYGGFVSVPNESPCKLLVSALKRLINMAEAGLLNINKLKIQLQEQYIAEMTDLNNEINKLKAENKVLTNSCQDYKRTNEEIAKKNRKLNEDLIELRKSKAELEELKSENKNLVNINTIFKGEIERLESAKPTKSLPAPVDKRVISLSEKCVRLETENGDLKSKNKEYEKLEKELLPIMVDTIYCTRKKGKSISLEISQIENIFSDMLKGKSKSEISKKYHIARSTITKVWNIDYTTSNSLKKIGYALHTVNGNWGDEKKQILREKIDLCQEKLDQAKYLEENSKAELKEQITGLSDFMAALNKPKQEKYNKVKRSKNGSRVIIEDLETDIEEFIYPFDEFEAEEEITI